MNSNKDGVVPIPSGIPAMLLAFALGAPAIVYFGTIQDWGGAFTMLTLPRMLLAGATLGGGLGGLVALFCGFHTPRGFCYLFGAAIGAVIGMIDIIVGLLCSFAYYYPDRYEFHFHDAFALSAIVVGFLAGAAVRRVVTRFGAKARAWAFYGAGVGFALPVPLDCAYQVTLQIAEKGDRLWNFGDRGASLEMPQVIPSFALGLALTCSIAVGWIGALAGAIRDSASPRPATPELSSAKNG